MNVGRSWRLIWVGLRYLGQAGRRTGGEYRRTGARREALLEMLKEIYGDEVYGQQIATLDTCSAYRDVREPEEGRADRNAGIRRRPHGRYRSDAYPGGTEYLGQVILTDGRTGETFERKVTVGYILHAEAASPCRRQDPCSFDWTLFSGYQQPLGGRRSSAASGSAKWRSGR